MAEIKYKETTIPIEAGQTVILNTIDRKLTGDIKVITPKAETIEEWDRSYTISGGVELISFAIYKLGDVVRYEAEVGMTWGEWVNSSYSNGEYYVADSFIIPASNPTMSVANPSGTSWAKVGDIIAPDTQYQVMGSLD